MYKMYIVPSLFRIPTRKKTHDTSSGSSIIEKVFGFFKMLLRVELSLRERDHAHQCRVQFLNDPIRLRSRIDPSQKRCNTINFNLIVNLQASKVNSYS